MILINGKKLAVQYFPNGEISLNEDLPNYIVGSKDKIQYVTLRFETNEDFTTLLFVSSWLLEEGYLKRCLVIPYLPYSRMDRKVSNHLFSLKYIANFINSLEFDDVLILEAHSDESMKRIKKSAPLCFTNTIVNKAMVDMQFDNKLDAVVFPDEGAKKRYGNLLAKNVRVLQGQKTRDFNTGEITGLQLIGDTSTPIRNVLIVDDLCSRGGTFIHVSKECKKIGIDRTFLAVTHLESNVYTGNLFDEVSKIYTTNALEPFLSDAHLYPQIQVFDLPSYLFLAPKKEEI